MNVLIIEDEALAAERLEKMITEVAPGVIVLAKLPGIRESVKWLMKNTADLIFLDIQLSDGLSFSIFEEIAVNTPVIFTTAYDQYTIKAFQLNSIAYLLKPVKKSELQASLEKYKSMKAVFTRDIENLLDTLGGRGPEYRKRFLIQFGDRIRKVEAQEVAYFYAMERSTFLATFQGQSYPVDYTLDRLEEMMDPGKFFRINRRYIVNMDAIAAMTAWSRSRIRLQLKPAPAGEDETLVSIDRATAFKQWLNS
jgi:DNA-binding LytR/AlgR family response regulator